MRRWEYNTDLDGDELHVVYGYWNDEGWWPVNNWMGTNMSEHHDRLPVADITSAVESAQMSLIAAAVASCTCGAESLSLGLHESHCRTLKIANALDKLDTIAALAVPNGDL